ncbi:MAG: OadG family transporter subunit [Bacteroidales bacterium]|nr:OadG family transporter subunit [Bacteroidales bacterium]
MIKYKIGLLLLMSCFIFSNIKAQRTSDLVINEVLVNNQNSFMDQNGERGAWIEIYNKSAGTVNIAGCYLTLDKNNLKQYPITKGDARTRIEPHQRIVFYCNSQTHRSVFHTNFSLNPNSTNSIYLVSANGKDIIDEVVVPVLSPDVSWGCQFDGKKETRTILKNATPSAANYVDMGSTSVEKFKESDPFGIGMAITAMSVVFVALLCLFLSFKIIGKIALSLTKSRARKAGASLDGTDVDTTEISGEVYAVIAMALHLHEEDAHDYEDTILTMKKVEKRYSPWSSKIYGLRENPSKKN